MKNKHFKYRLLTPMAMIVCLLLVLAVIAPSASALPAPPANEITLHIFKHWSDLVTYTLTYDVNGGDTLSTPPQQTAYADTTVRINSGIPTHAGYQFLGWALADNATTADYLPGGEILMDSDKTLYAVWQPEVTPGSVTTGFAENVSTSTATIFSSTYTGNFGGEVIKVGIQYSLNPSMADSMYAEATMGSPFTTPLNALVYNTYYYYRAFVFTTAGNFFGEIKMFKTYNRS